jgi:hypothetical protein
MDVEALIEAAKEIDRKAELAEARSRRFQELARLARAVEPDGPEHRRIQAESRELSRTVVDFGDAIADLRAALRRRPRKPSNNRRGVRGDTSPVSKR